MRHFLKLKESEPKDTLKYEMWKLIMNSLVGKFCQRSPEYDDASMISFMHKTGLEDLSDYRLRKYLYRPPRVGPCWIPEWATLILGRARALMAELVAKGSLFCSTDSGLFLKGTNLNCEALEALKSVGSDFIKEYECDSALLVRARLYALFKDGEVVKSARHGTIATQQAFGEILHENLEAGRDLEHPVKRIHLVKLKESLKKGKPLGKQEAWERMIKWGWDGKRRLVNTEVNIWKEYTETLPLEEVPGPGMPKPNKRRKVRKPNIGRPRALTLEQVKEAKKLHEQGLSVRDLAKIFKVGNATIHRALKS